MGSSDSLGGVPLAPNSGRWIAPPLRPRKRFFDLAWMWSIPMYGLGYLLGRFEDDVPLALTVVCVVWGLTFVAAVVVLPLREIWMRTLSRRDLLFADRVPGAKEFAVEIVVRYAGKELGADRGVLWFENGLLGFTGERTSFLLAYKDLQPPSAWTLSDFDRPFKPLSLRLGDGRAEVAVRPMWGQGWGYRRGLRRFLREKAATKGTRQWPPIRTYDPELPRLSDAPHLL